VSEDQPLYGAAGCCSGQSLREGESLTGTAPKAAAWLFVEYPGSWRAKAVVESSLDVVVKTRLLSLDGIRVQFIRRHGRHLPTGVRLFAAWVGTGGPWVETTVADNYQQLLEIDFSRLILGQSQGWAPHVDPLFLVCTNGRRDVCCAERGRPLVSALSTAWPDFTWETTHLGGHRFAGTMLVFPQGLALGRLDSNIAVAVVQQVMRGQLPTQYLRGYLAGPVN
jgi:hypothetical protein